MLATDYSYEGRLCVYIGEKAGGGAHAHVCT